MVDTQKDGIEFGNFDDFFLDEVAMRKGVKLDLQGGRALWVAHAGNDNREYTVAVSELLGPYQDKIDDETIDEDFATDLFCQIYAKTIVIDWENVLDKDGNELPCTEENVLALLRRSPKLVRIIKQRSTQFENYTMEAAKKEGN